MATALYRRHCRALGGVHCGAATLCVLTPVRGEAVTCGAGRAASSLRNNEGHA